MNPNSQSFYCYRNAAIHTIGSWVLNASLKLPNKEGRKNEKKEIEPIFKTFEPVFTLNTNSNFPFYTIW